MSNGRSGTVRHQVIHVCNRQERNHKGILTILAIYALFVFNGCMGIANAQSTNAKKVTAGSLQASPTTIDFGSVAVGKVASQNLSITNVTGNSLNIRQIVFSDTQFSLSGATLPLWLAAGQTGTIPVNVKPLFSGTLTGTLTIQEDPHTALVVGLSATATAAGLSVSPTTFSFGTVVDGQTKSQSITLTNTGSSTLTVSQISASGTGYSVGGLGLPANIAAGQSVTFNAQFAPTTTGSLNGMITVASNAPSSPASVSLTGTGAAATATMSASPASVAFGNVSLGTSTSQTATISNTGNSSVTISQIVVSATAVHTSGISIPTTLAPGQSAALGLTFAPTTSAAVSGTVMVSNSQGGSTAVSFTGTGVQGALTPTPSSVTFGSVTVGSANSQSIQLMNTGTGALSISQLSVTGAGFSAGSIALPISLNPGQATTFSVQFKPAAAGNIAGSASIVNNSAISPVVIPLSGIGLSATQTLSFSANALSFGTVNIGSSSTHSVTATNTGNADVQISQISLSGSGFLLSGAAAPVTLSPAQQLTFSVTFTPTTATSSSGTVTVSSNATGSPATITLSGTGASISHSVALNWSASTSTVVGYNVYRSTTSGSGYMLIGSNITGLGYTDSSVQNGMTYYYVTTGVNSSGAESVDSNQAEAVIP